MGELVPDNGDGLFVGRAKVGEVIALARMNVTNTGEGIALEVDQFDGQQKRAAAAACRFTHFDPGKGACGATMVDHRRPGQSLVSTPRPQSRPCLCRGIGEEKTKNLERVTLTQPQTW